VLESTFDYFKILSLLFFAILCMEALSFIVCWCLAQVKTSDVACLYMEVVDIGCIDFASPKNCRSIMIRKRRILVCTYVRDWK
jgi:hypothetical protein